MTVRDSWLGIRFHITITLQAKQCIDAHAVQLLVAKMLQNGRQRFDGGLPVTWAMRVDAIMHQHDIAGNAVVLEPTENGL
jgi:hypothetical protein